MAEALRNFTINFGPQHPAAHGVLRLVEVYGAALLAEEMEHVTRYLLSAGSDHKRQGDGLDALMRAMVQLPTYLERVLSGAGTGGRAPGRIPAGGGGGRGGGGGAGGGGARALSPAGRPCFLA